MSGHGYFGEYGGRFAAETLMAPLQELEHSWKEIGESQSFKDELSDLLENYAGRPTPLYRCARLSDKLDMDLWLKREDLLHTGAHKLNNSLGQTLLAKKMGKTHIIAETGAGQHGVATATASALLGLECTVYMGAIDAARQRPNVERMKLLGAKIELVHSGQKTLKDAVNEALRTWVGQPEESHYILGSALGPHPFPSMVAHFQKIIGEEARAQMLKATGELPDLAVACVGGGSNAIGLFRAFVEDSSVKLIGVEAGGRSLEPGAHAARFEGGKPGVLHGTYTWMLQDEHGQVLPTHSVSAGLDYPAVGPEHAWLRDEGRAAYYSAGDDSALLAFDMLAQYEGILPALESSHALGWVLEEKEKLRGQKILINLSGRGDKDLDHVLEVKGLS